VVLFGAGRLVGLPELFVAAAACLALLAGAVVYAQLVPITLRAEQRLLPSRVHLQRPSRVELVLSNVGRWSCPVLTVHDHFDGRRSTTFQLGPIGPSGRITVSYSLPTERRGVFEVGPLEVVLEDPFGLTERRTMAASPSRLVVFPRVEPLVLPAGRGGDDLRADHPRAGLLGRHDEQYSLRPYAVGDDLRRVHWPSTAHRGELMIRQDQMPGQDELTILLDLRRPVHTDSSLERAISVAASGVVAAGRAGQTVRLVTTGGVVSGFTEGRRAPERGPAHVARLLERLAEAESSSSSGLPTALAYAARVRGRRAQLLAITTSAVTPADLGVLYGLAPQLAWLVLVAGGPDARGPLRPPELPGVGVVTVGPGQPLAAAWARVPARASTRAAAGHRRPPAPVHPT
jgi:uncharacterized protein (DUF58 family)